MPIFLIKSPTHGHFFSTNNYSSEQELNIMLVLLATKKKSINHENLVSTKVMQAPQEKLVMAHHAGSGPGESLIICF